jgi:hypothetical protein
MTTPVVCAKLKHYTAKELVIGSSIDLNFEVGWIRQIQSISGAMGFVSCHY